jgi:hypothetical protein
MFEVQAGRKCFERDGYTIAREVLNQAEITRVRENLDRLLEKKCGQNPDGSAVRPERLWENHVEDPFWLDLCCHPRVLDSVESMLGPDLILLMSGLFVKPPRDGMPVDWHQDNTYWRTVRGTDIVTAWLAIEDVDRENGCMSVIPSTHCGHESLHTEATGERSVLNKKVVVTPELERNAIAIEMKAGDLSIHDSFILHSSAANTSNRRRAGYTMRYANPNTVTVDVEKHWVPIFLVRGGCGPYIPGAKIIDRRPKD